MGRRKWFRNKIYPNAYLYYRSVYANNHNTLIHARRIETVVSYKWWLGQIAKHPRMIRLFQLLYRGCGAFHLNNKKETNKKRGNE